MTAGSGHKADRSTAPGVLIWLSVLTVLSLTGLGFGLWAFFNPQQAAAPTASDDSLAVGVPKIMSEDELREYGATHGTVYWAGPDGDAQYELTFAADGSTFVRYLPPDASAGDPSVDFLSVATYAVADGFTQLQQAGEAEGGSITPSQSGAIIVTKDGEPTRAYFAFPDTAFQVEVYDPEEGAALELVENGSIVVLR